jgi:hypothetical protein
MLPGSLFGQHYVLSEDMRSGSSVYNQQITGYANVTFTLNRLTNLKSLIVLASGSGYSNMNVSVNPAVGVIYNQRDPDSGIYTFAAEKLPAGNYIVTITLSGTASETTPLHVTIVCTGDELTSPPETESPALSYYPDAITLGNLGHNEYPKGDKGHYKNP